MTEVLRHFSDDLLRGYAVGATSDGARLAVACHLEFCATCQRGAATHEAALDSLLHSSPVADSPPPQLRDRLLAGLTPQPPAPAPRKPHPLPPDMPPLPAALVKQLSTLKDVA